ncbi:Endonuclease MutS2 [Pseudochrobactrum sp. MP213Fo]
MKRKHQNNRPAPRISDKNTMKMFQLSEAKPDVKTSPPVHPAEQHHKFLKPEDRILWETVARSTRPLRPIAPKRTGIIEDFYLWDIENGISPAEVAKPAIAKAVIPNVSRDLTADTVVQKTGKQTPATNPLHDIDRPTIRKIAKGRVEIQARIDLHGMRQHEAHDLLYSFLADAWHRGLRFVLVITGKGSSSGSEGILKQAVPHWFSTPLFRIYVSAYEDAVRHHGGHGALYVRLRKTSAERLAESKLLPSRKRYPS